MMVDRRSALILLGIALLPLPALLPRPARAELKPEPSAAREFVKNKHRELEQGLAKAKDPRTDSGLLQTFDGMLDYDHFVQHSLSSHWESLNEPQRSRFSEVLRGLIRGSYRRNLSDLSSYDVKYTGESEGKEGVIVATEASDPEKKRREPLRIDYIVGRTAQGYRVRDIVTGGVSLVNNYRRQFGRIIKKSGFDTLMSKMEQQLDKLEASLRPG